MASKTPFSIPLRGSIAALCGGFASAIMVAAAAKHLALDGQMHLMTPLPAQKILPALLAFLSPLPLMLTTVAFGRVAGAVAILVGAAAFGALAPLLVGGSLADPQTVSTMALRGFGFAFVFGVPALLLGSLARPHASGVDPALDPRRGRPEERLVGRVLAAAIAVSAVLVAVGAVLVVQSKGGYAAVFQELVKQIQPILAADPGTKQVNPAWIARVLIWFGGLALGAEGVCLFALNLWLAGRIAQTSGLLARPWPTLPQFLRVPTPLAIVAAVAFGLSFAGGLVGLVAVIVAGAITAGFAFQGLAVVHQLTRGSAWRLPILFSIYFALSILPPLMLLLAAAGLCDAAFYFRDRERIVVKKKPGPKGPRPWS